MDGVKIIADGIRLEKKINKAGAKGKRQTRRSATHDVTDIKKDDADVIINATKADENTAEADENTAEADEEGSVNRTEENEKESEE